MITANATTPPKSTRENLFCTFFSNIEDERVNLEFKKN